MKGRIAEYELSSASCKTRISNAFSRAASTYDNHALLQRQVGEALLEKMPTNLEGATVLDLGCGTGYFSLKLKARGANVICVDLSEKMLLKATERCGHEGVVYIRADAENLPIAFHSVDFIFSSLALQWCEDLCLAFKECKRILKHDGRCYFSTLLDGTLHELKSAWETIDLNRHVNEFLKEEDLNLGLERANCKIYNLDLPVNKLWYDSSIELLKDLKGIGATHVSGKATGLTKKAMLEGLEEAYQVFRDNNGKLPATYHVCIGEIQ